MKLRATFELPVAPPRGVRIHPREDLRGFRTKIADATLDVTLAVTERLGGSRRLRGDVWVDVPNPKTPQRYLTHLIVQVARDCDAPPLTREIYESLRRPAAIVLRNLLVRLREVLERPGLDVRLSGLVWIDCVDEEGHKVVPAPPLKRELSSIGAGRLRARYLTHERWAMVTRGVAASQAPPLAEEWLRDARSLLENSDYAMALIASAVACELLLHRIAVKALQQGGRVTANQAAAFSEQLSNRLMPLLVVHLGALGAREADAVRATFELRNAVVHGKRTRPISHEEAAAAVRAAEALRFYEGARPVD